MFAPVLVTAGQAVNAGISGEGLTLCVSAESLKELGDLGRSKYGISFKQGDTEISLQIDLKLQKPRVA